ncbi:PAS domain-containing protein [Paraflavisolibacter sp. H34]|uniref:PAS domain-containing protein n=1 Tax=Huijunlia imazamoxiresistens TaxID=3127457 RepID=UPI0030184655
MQDKTEILDKLNEGFLELDNDCRIIYVNSKTEEFFGRKKSEMMGQLIWDLFPQAAGTPLFLAIEKACSQRIPLRGEFLLPSSGRYIFSSIMPNGNSLYLHFYDIQEAREAHRMLSESEEHFRTLVENTPDAISRWNRELKLIYSNPAFSQKIGVGHPNLSGRTDPGTGLPLEIAHRWRRKLQQVFDSGVPAEDYDFYPARDQTTVYFFTRMVPEFGPDGAVETILSVSRDVTEMKKVENELMESRHFIREITDAAPEITYVLDITFNKMVYANNRIHEVFGTAETTGYQQFNLFEKMVHPDDRARMREHLDKLAGLRNNEKKELRLRLRVAGGGWHWFRFQDRVFKRHEDGRVSQIIGLVQDVTEEMQAKEELNHNLSILARAEFIAHIGSWVYHLETGKVEWSAEVYRIYGYEPYAVEASLDLVQQHVFPEDFGLMVQMTEHALATRTNVSYRCRIQPKGGGIKHVYASLGFDERYPDNMVGILQDVTQEALLHQQLTERQQFIDSMIDNSVDRIQAFDPDLRILVWNKKCEEYYGLKKSEVMGRRLLDFFPKVQGQNLVLDAILRAFTGERTYVPPQQEIYANSIAERFYVPIKNEKGEVYSVIGILHDVTKAVKAGEALKELNRSLEEKNKELEEKNEEISSFAFIASHDLKEPLRKIHTYSHWLEEKEAAHLSEKGKEYFHRISDAVKRMDALIGEIMVLTRINSDRSRMSQVDLNTVLRHVQEELHPLVLETKARIQFESLPAIKGNESQLFFLFKNLLHNALVFQAVGNPPVIEISAATVSSDDLPPEIPSRDETAFIRVSIQDNGIGFHQKYIRKAFQVFQRLHPRHHYQGTGMGLAICKKIMEIHNGFITAHSEEGRGSVFSCFFPV